jgi:hypothetical protein
MFRPFGHHHVKCSATLSKALTGDYNLACMNTFMFFNDAAVKIAAGPYLWPSLVHLRRQRFHISDR